MMQQNTNPIAEEVRSRLRKLVDDEKVIKRREEAVLDRERRVEYREQKVTEREKRIFGKVMNG